MKHQTHLDDLLTKWSFDPTTLNVRLVKGKDGRDVIQMRIDLGVLQLETTGRPDGAQIEQYESYLDRLRDMLLQNPDYELTDEECAEIDREFMQFYHRRICWLRLQYYHRAVMDADHTLQLMDLTDQISDDEEWRALHQQYRPLVLFHRTQAAALGELEDNTPEEAVQAITTGLDSIRSFFEQHDLEEHFEEDELVIRLVEMREQLRNEYSVGQTLREKLAQAVAQEEYELAAKLRDELSRRESES